jgi:hypothetical protein
MAEVRAEANNQWLQLPPFLPERRKQRLHSLLAAKADKAAEGCSYPPTAGHVLWSSGLSASICPLRR